MTYDEMQEQEIPEPEEQEEEIVDEVEEEEDDLEELDFAKLFGEADEDITEESEEEQEQDEEPEEEVQAIPQYDPETDTWVDPNTGDKLLPQQKVNEIVGSSRIKGREYEENVRQLEEMMGMPFHQITQKLQSDQVERFAEEKNWDPQDAHSYLENKQARELYEKELLGIRHQQQLQQHMIQYNNEKSQYLTNPLVKQYEKEIDAISRGGENVSWTVAMNHVLGQKAVEGELGKTMQRAAEKRINKVKKPQMAPESGGGYGVSQSIPKEIAFFAKQLGEDPKESFEEYKKIQKER